MRPASVRTSNEDSYGAALAAAFLVGATLCGCARQFFTAETQRAFAVQFLDAATRQGRRPRRPDGRGAQGQRSRCPPRLWCSSPDQGNINMATLARARRVHRRSLLNVCTFLPCTLRLKDGYGTPSWHSEALWSAECDQRHGAAQREVNQEIGVRFSRTYPRASVQILLQSARTASRG